MGQVRHRKDASWTLGGRDTSFPSHACLCQLLWRARDGDGQEMSLHPGGLAHRPSRLGIGERRRMVSKMVKETRQVLCCSL